MPGSSLLLTSFGRCSFPFCSGLLLRVYCHHSRSGCTMSVPAYAAFEHVDGRSVAGMPGKHWSYFRKQSGRAADTAVPRWLVESTLGILDMYSTERGLDHNNRDIGGHFGPSFRLRNWPGS